MLPVSIRATILTTMTRMNSALTMVLGLALCLVMAGCEGTPLGPSLANVAITTPPELVPTFNSDPASCCCRVTGTVTNNNSVPVHVTLKYAAFQSATSPDPFASLVYFIEDLQPGARHVIGGPGTTPLGVNPPSGGLPTGAPGFLVPCNALNRDLVRTELSVRGIAFPPH